MAIGGGVDHAIGDGDRRSHHPPSFVERQLAATTVRPPVTLQNWTQEVIWFNLLVVIATPLLSLWGLCTTAFTARTFAFCTAYYVFNMIGMSADYSCLGSLANISVQGLRLVRTAILDEVIGSPPNRVPPTMVT